MVVYINVSKRILHPQVQEYRDVTGIALGDFYDMFNNLDLAGIHTAQDVDEAAELLTHNINLVLNKYAPVKKRILRFKTSAHWLIIVRNNMIKNMINDDDADWEAFRRFRNQLKSDLMRAKREWIRRQISRDNLDSKARWRALMSAVQGNRNENNISLNSDDGLIFHPEAVANHLNRYYVKKVEDIIEASPPDPDKALKCLHDEGPP